MRKVLLLTVPTVLIIVGTMTLLEHRAYAYTDPGTGLLAIQTAGSALIAAGWYLRRKIYAVVRRISPDKYPTEEHSPTEDGEGTSRR